MEISFARKDSSDLLSSVDTVNPKGPFLLLKYLWYTDVSYGCGINLHYLCFQLYEKNQYILKKISMLLYLLVIIHLKGFIYC